MRLILIEDPETGELIQEYTVPVGEHLVVTNEMLIEKGTKITDGPVSPHDILKIKGLVEAQQFILESVQQVYREQGVAVNDKHIEIIVKQMFQKIKIKEAGDSLFLEDELIDKKVVERENEILISKGKRPATYEPVIQGITKAAVNTESFISASSFQDIRYLHTIPDSSPAIALSVKQLRHRDNAQKLRAICGINVYRFTQ